MKDMLGFRLYWFQNSSVLSVGIGWDEDKLEEFEVVDTEEDLDRNEFSENLYFPKREAGGQPDPGEKDFVLFFVDLISTGVT